MRFLVPMIMAFLWLFDSLPAFLAVPGTLTLKFLCLVFSILNSSGLWFF